MKLLFSTSFFVLLGACFVQQAPLEPAPAPQPGPGQVVSQPAEVPSPQPRPSTPVPQTPVPHAGSSDVHCGARLGNTCQTGQYCQFEDQAICGHADATGICKIIPTMCTREYRPVCGCDQKTYSNRCSANASGTSVLSKGACQNEKRKAATVQSCGGITGRGCPRSYICVDDPKDSCSPKKGGADCMGICVTQ